MNSRSLVYRILALLATGAIAGLLISSNTKAEYPSLVESEWDGQLNEYSIARKPMMSQVDRHFIEMMIPHHQGAIDMAELALVQAKHPEIKNLAKAIKQDRSREIQLMRTWYKKWYRTEVAEVQMMHHGMMGRGMSMHPDMMGMQMDLNALKNAADFDREFIRQMIPHHQMAVMMSQMVLKSATHSEIRTLAQSIIKSQNAEIEQMRQWYQSWYQSSPSG
ncbi:MAG: DUF305 domain-containing protein [Cyanosarcina radialis HA8281-LM2]|jgi:uncharacterized protein (DUF305 family)|nr:DUF305 domain-containing protein [Cyanosarcina radialis HA8281-LM2]